MPKSNAQVRQESFAVEQGRQPEDQGDHSSLPRGQAVRARLLTAAAELISEIGWTAVSTRVLAERAGVGPGLVHYHFDSLQALLRQAVMTQMHQVLGEATAQLANAEDIAAAMQAMTAGLDEYVGGDESARLLVEAYLAATRDPELHEQMSTVMLGLRAEVSGALADAGHPRPEAAAALVLAAMDGLVLQRGLDPELRYADVAPLLGDLLRTET